MAVSLVWPSWWWNTLVVAATLRAFNVDEQRVRYFVLNNAYNNDTAVACLASEFSFNKA
jgi:hypothetical protein